MGHVLAARRCCRGEHVTEREVAVLVRVASGATNVRIAHELHVSQSTVRQHLTSLFRRLGVPSRGALVARAVHVGLLDVAAWPPTPTSVRCVARSGSGSGRPELSVGAGRSAGESADQSAGRSAGPNPAA